MANRGLVLARGAATAGAGEGAVGSAGGGMMPPEEEAERRPLRGGTAAAVSAGFSSRWPLLS